MQQSDRIRRPGWASREGIVVRRAGRLPKIHDRPPPIAW